MAWRYIEEAIADDPPSPEEAAQVFEYARRKAKPRFYTDENFPQEATKLLRNMGASVKTAAEAGLLGHSDEDHAAYALRRGLILISCDRDFLDERRFPLIQSPALFVFNFGSGSATEVVAAFRCLASAFSTPQFFDKWAKTDAGREGWVCYSRHLNGTTSRSRYRIWHGRLQEWATEV